jgi:anionic cell wall polymer biosynthesis LytR-Cps2A-Psr (LCP) family protein
MQVIGDYYGLPIEYYLRVNFSGFVKIIDTLGGVDVDSDVAFTSARYHYDKGINHLSGEAALRFVRERHAFKDGDRARGRHQMAVIKGVIKGLVSFNALTNYSELMDNLSGSFLTNAPKSVVGDLVRLTLDSSKGKWKVFTYSVNGYDRMDRSNILGFTVYVMAPNTYTVDYARSLIIKVASGEPLTQAEINENAPGQ